MSEKRQLEKAPSGGYDYNFVDSPPDDLQCSICLMVLKEPLLTSCCGNHFCRTCVKHVELEQRPCPLCSAASFSTMLDKYFARKVNELQVECPHRDKGCRWVGNLGSLERHLDAVTGDCNFMMLDCSYQCGVRVHHSQMASHQSACPRRPYTCKFCGYNGVFEDMSRKHWKVCDKYPIPCPNQCGEVDIPRCEMGHHLSVVCSLQESECEFAHASCPFKGNRDNLAQHMASSLQEHLSLVSRKCLNLTNTLPMDFQQQFENRLTLRDQELQSLTVRLGEQEVMVAKLLETVASLQEEIADLKEDSIQLKSTVFVPPFEFVMTNFHALKVGNEQWLGPPFYSHIGGYRMCITVDANGSEDGVGTHVSVYANLMKGEFDDNLRWPFRGSVTLQLRNQRKKEGKKEAVFEETILFSHGTAREASGRVEVGEVAESGLGISRFIGHNQLGYNASKNTEYLRHNCLHFYISKVDVSS